MYEDVVDPRAAGELEMSMFIVHIFIESKEDLLPAIPVLFHTPSTEQNFQKPLFRICEQVSHDHL
jgi:hypothetical protein